MYYSVISGSRESSVGIETELLNGRMSIRGSIPGRSNRLFSTASRPAVGSTQSPIQWVPKVLSSRVKRQGSETDHSPPSSAEVKNDGSILSLPHTSSLHGD
jgi:hypothetical protein